MSKTFPFHQGRFQGGTPPVLVAVIELRFHSTKEGFKGRTWLRRQRRRRQFPFHQGRFQGIAASQSRTPQSSFPFHQGRFQGGCFGCPMPFRTRFHSTKEGFKVHRLRTGATVAPVFPFHQGRFQGACPSTPCHLDSTVSIPPRKVSRPINNVGTHVCSV